MVPIRTSRLPGALAPFRFPGAAPAWAASMADSTHERASASSSLDTVRGIMISTIGWPPAATRSRAASMRARTCMA